MPEYEGDFFSTLSDELSRVDIEHETNSHNVRAPFKFKRFSVEFSVTAALVVIALVTGMVAHYSNGDSDDNLQMQLVSKVIADSNVSYASLHGLSTTTKFTEHGFGFPNVTGTMQKRLKDNGSFWSSSVSDLASSPSPGQATHLTSESAYDAESGILLSCQSDESNCTRTTDDNDLDFSVSGLALAQGYSFILANAKDAQAKSTTYKGYDVWQITGSEAAKKGKIRLVVMLDKQTGVVLSSSITQGNSTSTFDVTDLQVNPSFTSNDFEVASAADRQIDQTSRDYKRSSLADVGPLVGYQPIVPAYLPTGFHLAEVSYARNGPIMQNQPFNNVVVLTYRSGLNAFTVMTLDSGDDIAAWTDPMGLGQFKASDITTKLTSGAFAKSGPVHITDSAPSSASVFSNTHLWTVGDNRLVLGIQSDLPHAELLKIANSMRPYTSQLP